MKRADRRQCARTLLATVSAALDAGVVPPAAAEIVDTAHEDPVSGMASAAQVRVACGASRSSDTRSAVESAFAQLTSKVEGRAQSREGVAAGTERGSRVLRMDSSFCYSTYTHDPSLPPIIIPTPAPYSFPFSWPVAGRHARH